MQEFATYPLNPAAAANMAAAVIVLLVGGGVMLYERFSAPSRHLAAVTTLLGMVLVFSSLLELAGGPEAGAYWFRLALATDALMLPAVYTLALQLVGTRRPRLARLMWLTGVAFFTWCLASPAMVASVLAVADAGPLAPTAWIGSTFVLFLIAVLGATVAELALSYRRAPYGDDRRRVLTLAGGFCVGALSMVDFFYYPQPWAGGATPIAVTGTVIVFGYAAIRFRAFSPLPSFAAERILQVMRDGVLLCDEAGRIRNANAAACELLGKPERMLAGVSAAAMIRDLPDAADATPSLHEEVRDRQMLLLQPDGGTVEVSLSNEPLRQRGAVVGSVIVFRDIRERLRAARALRATEQRYHSLFWNNPGLVYEIDATGAILQANPAVERMLGVSAADLVGRSFNESVHPDDAERVGEAFRRVLAGEAVESRFRVVVHDADILEIRAVSIPVVRDGAVVGVFGVALDITAEERVRRELELQRMEFAALFEASPEAILIADENDVVLRVNPEFTRTFGYEPGEATGRSVDELLVPPGLEHEGAAMTAAARRGEVVRVESVRRCRDGSLVDVSVLARELRLPGRPPALYGIYRDITDRKRAETSLRERDEELRHAQRLDSIGKLAGGVAHDFNNLVTVINGHVAFALEALPDEHPVRHDLEEVERAGSRAANLTQQLLAFSRRQVLRPEAVDAVAVIDDVRRMLGRIIGEHIHFEVSHSGPAQVHADRGQLEQILVNLVVNARDAMPGGGRIRITTERAVIDENHTAAGEWNVAPGEFVLIAVADTGVGMDETTRARAFDPFFTTKEQGKGTGLGLATVFGIVKQSGGHVTATSAPGRGTTIRMWLPAAPGAAAPAPAASDGATPLNTPWSLAFARRESANGAGPGTRPGHARILLVEDETALRGLAARVLRRAGHEVFLAANGVEALAVAAEQEVDLVVSDLVMPRMGGRELSRRLRDSFPHLPIILMTGYDDEIATGGTSESILSKPFTPAELALRVEQSLRAACIG